MIDELYDLIGGKRTVWAATEAFYRRVFADETLRPFFKSTDMAQLRARQSMFISMLLGGKDVYTDKDIHAAHAPARGQGCRTECCGDSYCGQCYDYHKTHTCVRKPVQSEYRSQERTTY